MMQKTEDFFGSVRNEKQTKLEDLWGPRNRRSCGASKQVIDRHKTGKKNTTGKGDDFTPGTESKETSWW